MKAGLSAEASGQPIQDWDSQAFRQRLKSALKPPEVWQPDTRGGLRPAAVLIPLFQDKGQWQVLLNKRAEGLKHHAGQISFPGGAFEPTDANIRHTALRETHEELGLDPAYIEIVGYLDELETISGYRVTPFVALLKPGFSVQVDPGEVAEAFSVPLDFFLDPANRRAQGFRSEGKRWQTWVFHHQGHTIWGATAQMLVNLAEKLQPPAVVSGDRSLPENRQGNS